MSKHGWTYKKLGEVATIISGSTPKTNIPEYWDGAHFWVTPAELGKSVYIGETERTITDDAVNNTNLTLLPVGTVLLSSRAPIGKIAITTAPMYCNQGFKNIVCSEELNNKFTYYFIGHIVPYLQSLGRGATFKEISKTIVENVKLPVPPMEEQLAIVAELDEINETIELLKLQVADLDALAQSTFYTMFGDPITNEKGWEIKKLGSLCTIERGGSPRPIKDFITEAEDGINWIKIGDAKEGSIFIDSTAEKIKPEGMKKSRFVQKGDFILSNSMSFGRPYILRVDGCIHDGWLVIRDDNHIFDKFFLFYFLSSQNVYNEFKRLAVGGVVNNLNSSMVRALSVFVPPITTQQEFAKKVEAIESAKVELIAQISEMQNLLASRMDYYFD